MDKTPRMITPAPRQSECGKYKRRGSVVLPFDGLFRNPLKNLQTNVIEAGADMKREGEKEWYFGNADKERLGPYSIEEIQAFWNDGTIHAKTRCWAQVSWPLLIYSGWHFKGFVQSFYKLIGSGMYKVPLESRIGQIEPQIGPSVPKAGPPEPQAGLSEP